MKAVWDFPLTLEPEQYILVPKGAEPLSVRVRDTGVHHRPICLYVLVDPNCLSLCRRKVTLADGGIPRCEVTRNEFVDTVCLGRPGGYIAHVFLCAEELPA